MKDVKLFILSLGKVIRDWPLFVCVIHRGAK